jgi:nitroreductase
MSNAWDRTAPTPSPYPPAAPEAGPAPLAVTRVLKRTRQVRDFLPTAVPEPVLTDILDVARWTGSGGNRQPWTFIVVTDPATKARMAAIATNTPHIGIAPVVICIATVPHGNPDSESFDEGRLTERIMIAATAHGLASGIGRARREHQAEIGALLGVPADQVLRSMVSIGYPTEAGRAPKAAPGTARKPLTELVRRERYG